MENEVVLYFIKLLPLLSNWIGKGSKNKRKVAQQTGDHYHHHHIISIPTDKKRRKLLLLLVKFPIEKKCEKGLFKVFSQILSLGCCIQSRYHLNIYPQEKAATTRKQDYFKGIINISIVTSVQKSYNHDVMMLKMTSKLKRTNQLQSFLMRM